MVLVKVSRITGITDPVTGNAGRQIEFTEYSSPPVPGDDMTRTMMYQLQSMLPVQLIKDIWTPKMVLFLKENEYLQLGMPFEVNDIYEVIFENGNISFKRATADR